MKKQLFILLLMGAGLAWMPGISYACHSSSEKTEASSRESKKVCHSGGACCAGQLSQKDSKNCCDGHCPQNACHCSSIPVTFFLVPGNEIKCRFFTARKLRYYPQSFDLSPGFYLLWLPPKIG
ncbi:MAG TPA: hypothetical protein VG847_06420 [Chitinophagaceae bacterium]|nr:hypothetical protein [Chitinophagaceae bacterium]